MGTANQPRPVLDPRTHPDVVRYIWRVARPKVHIDTSRPARQLCPHSPGVYSHFHIPPHGIPPSARIVDLTTNTLHAVRRVTAQDRSAPLVGVHKRRTGVCVDGTGHIWVSRDGAVAAGVKGGDIPVRISAGGSGDVSGCLPGFAVSLRKRICAFDNIDFSAGRPAILDDCPPCWPLWRQRRRGCIEVDSLLRTRQACG